MLYHFKSEVEEKVDAYLADSVILHKACEQVKMGIISDDEFKHKIARLAQSKLKTPAAQDSTLVNDVKALSDRLTTHIQNTGIPGDNLGSKLDDEKLKMLGKMKLEKVNGTDTLVIKGVNIQLVNGKGKTSDINGLGNLIIGYNTERKSSEGKDVRTGSHNIVVGDKNNYSSHSGIVAGHSNFIAGPCTSIVGGMMNYAQGEGSAIVGWKNFNTKAKLATNGNKFAVVEKVDPRRTKFPNPPPSSPSEGDVWENCIGMEFVFIPPTNGKTFLMGSPGNEPSRLPGELLHPRRIDKAFWIMKHEVSNDNWMTVEGSIPSKVKDGNKPVTNVGHSNCIAYCEKLRKHEKKLNKNIPSLHYRLPSEAQWEYACRAGSTDMRYGNLDEIAHTYANTRGAVKSIGILAANDYGLKDMLGNVIEYCLDRWHSVYEPNKLGTDAMPKNEEAWTTGGSTYYVVRGGCVGKTNETQDPYRAAYRSNGRPDGHEYYGFRIVFQHPYE